MRWEDDFADPPAPADTKTLDLFSDARQPPPAAQLLDRCPSGCVYIKSHPLDKFPRCSKCNHEYGR